jgi:hypothetical protein
VLDGIGGSIVEVIANVLGKADIDIIPLAPTSL